MRTLYNDNDPYCAEWLRGLMARGRIPDGDIDDRDIRNVDSGDLRGYRQVHLFAGIGGWAYALQLAGWPDDREVWTLSCPCQPFSNAGKRRGEADARHLWPEARRLIAECQPAIIFGEQVASKAGREWLARVRADLEAQGYVVGAADLCAASVGAPHIRQRLFFVAHADRQRAWRYAGDGARPQGAVHRPRREDGDQPGDFPEPCGATGALAHADPEQHDRGRRPRTGRRVEPADGGATGALADHDRRRRESQPCAGIRRTAVHDTDGRGLERVGWSDCEWLICTDGKARPTQPGLFPLAHGISGRMVVRRTVKQAGASHEEEHWYSRVGALRGLGNAIVPQVAAQFIAACIEIIRPANLILVPLTLRQAREFVAATHRHHRPPVSHKFSIGIEANGIVVGVAMAGRPVARHFDDGFTLEVNRTCTDGTPNANSMLYGAVWRAAKAMGYRRCITYTQEGESGASLRAAGFVRVRELPARKSWRESTRDPKLRAGRDPIGSGGVARTLWEVRRKGA